jgi:hypothetical protein
VDSSAPFTDLSFPGRMSGASSSNNESLNTNRRVRRDYESETESGSEGGWVRPRGNGGDLARRGWANGVGTHGGIAQRRTVRRRNNRKLERDLNCAAAPPIGDLSDDGESHGSTKQDNL